MSGFKFKCLAVALLLLVAGLTIHCDDEKKLVCCWCECILKGGEEWVPKIETVSGDGISCKSACNQECQREARWELDNFANIDCSQMPKDTEGGDDDDN